MNKNPLRENLKPFKKGEDKRRNMNGAPKLPDLQILLAEVLGKETNGKTAAQTIIDALRAKAAKGDVRAAELLLDRGWGKIKQSVELANPEGQEFKITLTL